MEHKIKHRVALNNNTRKPISEWKDYPYKLKEEDVEKIFKMKETHSQQKIADEFGVAQTTISAVLRKITWKDSI